MSTQQQLNRVTAVTSTIAMMLTLSACATAAEPPQPTKASQSRAPLSSAVLLVAPSAAPGTGAGASAAGQLPLGLSPTRCITVGDAILYAPPGSSITDDAQRVKLAGIGEYALGDRLPIVQGTTQNFTTSDLPTPLRRCGPGKYTVIIGPA